MDMFNDPLIQKMRLSEEVLWLNGSVKPYNEEKVAARDVSDAEERLKRFAPVIMKLFPETKESGGIIESELTFIPDMAEVLNKKVPLFIKRDSDLPISGSVKARGGIYEVLKHTEDITVKEGIIADYNDDYLKITSESARKVFSRYKIQVGSTGNLGMSIGIMSAALGFEAIVHMSCDAKQWKKDKLRQRGARVIEYEGDYGEAVKRGRARSDADESSYFVDDENSKALFCGYAVAGNRLKKQLDEMNIEVSSDNPLYVYIPCGVGGAPGGISFGLKLNFGENVHCYFAEPTEAPCMLLGIISGLYDKISVQDIGLSGKTQADGLAVGRCSAFAAGIIAGIIDGEATVSDEKLHVYCRQLWNSERIFIEPSACAAFEAFIKANDTEKNGTHIIWATGGSMVPDAERKIILD